MARSVRICFLAPNAFPVLADDRKIPFIGGAELQQVMIAKGLRKRGYSVSMICLDFGQARQTNVDGITVYRAFQPTSGIPVLRFFWPRLTSVWRCLKRADADIYYYRTAGMWAGIIAAFGRSHDRRTIFAAAGNPDLEKNTSRIRFARDRWIYEYGLRNVDKIFVQNQEQERMCRKNFDRIPDRIPNCFEQTAINTTRSGSNILWVSTVRPVKRPQLFLDLAEALPQYQFQIVGGPSSTDESLYESVKARAAGLKNLHFAGYVPYSDVGQFFDRAAIFVNTSESEGFPNTFMQSWARGIPTVSYVDSGARLNGRPLGRIVASPGEMINVIVNLMDDDAEREVVGDECRRYLQQNHSLDHVLDLYEEAFLSLLDNTDGAAERGSERSSGNGRA